jgi:hypothetical protein
VPTRSFAHARWSTLLPYGLPDGRRVVVGARPVDDLGAAPAPTTFDELRKASTGGDLQYALDLAEPMGDWTEAALLEIGTELSDDEAEGLRFNPANAGGGFEPVGVLQTIRRRAYEGSQSGRPTPSAPAHSRASRSTASSTSTPSRGGSNTNDR